MLYFIVASTMMVIVGIWGIGISGLDSHEGIDLATYSYILVALSMIITIEPWIATLNLLFLTICLNLHMALSSTTSDFYGFGVIVNSLSVFAISVLASCFTFNRRVTKLNYEIENEKLLEQIEKQAIIDDLTGIYNRRYLTAHINDPLKIGSNPTGIMMLDIDHFKEINDIYGHKVGDDTLKMLGTIISNFVGNEGYCVRYGGEEFLIYYKNTNKDDLFNKAEMLRKKFEELEVNNYSESSVRFTVSIGLAIASGRLSYSGLISVADKNLYKAKETRNTVYID